MKLMVLYKVLWWWPQIYNEFKEHEKNSDFKILKVMKFIFKSKFNHVLLSIKYNDNFWRSQLDILHLSI